MRRGGGERGGEAWWEGEGEDLGRGREGWWEVGRDGGKVRIGRREREG